ARWYNIPHAYWQDRLSNSLKNTACGDPHRVGRCRDTRRYRHRTAIFDCIEDRHPDCSSTVYTPRGNPSRPECPTTDGRREPPSASSTLTTLDRRLATSN